MSKSKKRIAQIIALVFLIASVSPLNSVANANGVGVCGSENFAGGTGLPGDPFLVHDQNALNELRDCGLVYRYYTQTQDISLTGIWSPITSFTGNYQGQNHSITGIEIVENENTVGLFGEITSSYISNLTISGSVSNTGLETGLLAGAISNGTTVTAITASANVVGYQDTGGLIGAVYSSAVNDVTVNPLDENSEVTVTSYSGGGVFGFVLNSDIDMVQANIDVVGLVGAAQIGGIYGAAVWNFGEEFTHTFLIYGGDVIALNEGSYRCGGIAGAGTFPIEGALVINSEVTCEHLDIGGAVGYFTSTLSNVRVEAAVEARKANDIDDETQIGGLIGYWSVTQPQSIQESYFSGDLTGENNMGGLVGVLNFSSAPDGADITISHAYSVGSFVESNGASGFVSTIITSDDPLIRADLIFDESYTSMAYSQESEYNDAISASFYEIDIQNVLWNSSKQNAQSQYFETVPGVSYKTMLRPLYWANRGFDFVEEWAMNSSLNSSLPVLKTFFPDAAHNVVCTPKTYAPIYFAKNSYKLTTKAKRQLRAIATKVLAGNCINLISSGHTSGHESRAGKTKKKFQMMLSTKRATVVSEYLYELFFAKRFYAGTGPEGLSATNKVNKDRTKKQQAANRRVVVSTVS